MDKTEKSLWIGVALTAVVFVSVFVFAILTEYADYAVITIVVQEKERVNQGNDSKYLIFTEDEVFRNTDSLFHGKFDSSDVYRKMVVGESYQVAVSGWRIPLLSLYRNIVRIIE